MGYTDEAIAGVLGDEDAEPDFIVWAENARTWEVWHWVCDMWRVAPMGGVLGLDYPCVESTMRMMGIKNQREIFFDLRAMDRAARDIINEKAPS